MKKLILIDGHALVHRAFHALPPGMNSPTGLPTNAVYGFTSVLMKMMKDIKPDYIVATFDLAGGTFRHEEFAEYKATRQKAPDELHAQVPLVKEILANFGIPIFEKEGFEADDVIGSLACIAKKEKDLQVIIMTGDLDTLQLVEDDKVVVLTLRKGVTDTILYNEKEVIARYGLPPNQLVDFKGLKGDPSDNIPGVPGIGDKTASTLMQEFGTIENLYRALEADEAPSLSEKLKEKLLANKDMAVFSKRLATIICNIEIPFSLEGCDWKQHADVKKLEAYLKELGIFSLAKRIPEALNGSVPLPPTLFPVEDTGIPIKDIKKISELGTIPALAVEIVNDMMLLAHDDTTIYRTPLQDLPTNIEYIGHDLKLLMRALASHKQEAPKNLFDTKIAAYLMNPDQRDYDLYKVYYALTGKTADENPELRPHYILTLRKILSDRMQKLSLDSVFRDIEMPLIPVVADMEHRGILIDIKGLKKLLIKNNKALGGLEKKIYAIAGGPFNINSPKQLSEIIFHKLGLKGKVRKTGGGVLSTAAPELEKLRELHPVIDLVLEYRELQKLKTTYIEPFPSLIGSDGRIHTTYNQTVAATGRLSSQDPNLQNIPTKTDLGQQFRKAFVAEKGFELVSFDYTQLELRLVAHIAKDKVMIDAFKRDEDIHTRTAVEIFDVTPDTVTKEMRRQAKVLNFGIIYGMGIMGFSRASGVPREQARQFIDAYFTEFKGVARYMDDMKKFARDHGYVETVFGRKRLLPDITSTMPQLQAQAERMAINHPVQGTEADLIKLAMIAIDAHLTKQGLSDDVRMLLQVHDELVFEIKKDLVKKIAPVIKKAMETVRSFDVPITVDIKHGPNWSDMEPLDVS